MRERLIGAIVLVVAVVILVPWLVSRAHRPRYRVANLPPPVVQTSAAPSVLQLPPLPRSAPGAVAKTAVASLPASSGLAAGAKPGIQPGSVASGFGERTATTDGWFVQAASFSARGSAQDLAGRLKHAGFNARLSAHEVGGKTWYRVRVGPYADENAARAAMSGVGAIAGTDVVVRREDGGGG